MSNGSNDIEMKHKEEWQAIEDGLDLVKELTGLIGSVLVHRNQEHPVEEAIKLTSPDIRKIFELVEKIEDFAHYLKEDGHSDTIQRVATEAHIVHLQMLRNLIKAMHDLDQETVNSLVETLEVI